MVLISLEGDILMYVVRLQFLATNNKVKYEALLTGLKLAKSVRSKGSHHPS